MLSELEYDQLAEQLERELNEAGTKVSFRIGRYMETLPLRSLDEEDMRRAEEYSGYHSDLSNVVEALVIFWEITINTQKLMGTYWLSPHLAQDAKIDRQKLIFPGIGEEILRATGLS